MAKKIPVDKEGGGSGIGGIVPSIVKANPKKSLLVGAVMIVVFYLVAQALAG